MRVDLVDPGPGGAALEAALRAAGARVEVRALDALGATTADVVVLAGDAPGALEALRALRDDGARPDTPVVLVGTPPGTEPGPEGPGFGAELVLGRARAAERIADVAREVARTAGSEPPAPRLREDGPVVRGLRERTMDLGRARSEVVRHEPDERSHVSEIERRAPAEDARGAIEPLAPEAKAPISAALAALLRAADRRVFPSLPPLDPSIPAGEDDPRELLPDDVLEAAAPGAEEEDAAMESLTFVGGPAPLPSAGEGSRPGTSVTPAALRRTLPGTPGTVHRAHGAKADGEQPADAAGGERPTRRPSTAPDRAEATRERAPSTEGSGSERVPALRDGEGTPLGALRALLGAWRARHSGPCALSWEGGALVLGLRAGECVSLRGGVALRALAGLGRAVSREDEAQEALDRLVGAGILAPVELGRRLREAAEAELLAALSARTLRWTFEGPPPAVTERPLGRRLGPALAALAARAFSPDAAASLLGGLDARWVPRAAFERATASLELAPELDRALEGQGSRSVRGWLAAGAGVVGWPGLLVALAAAEGLEPAAAGAGAPLDDQDRARVEDTLRALARRVEDADYFTLLEVSRAATDAEVARAWSDARGRLVALPLEPLGLEALEPTRASTLAALDEAHRVLRVARWREAYALGLARAEGAVADTAFRH